MGQKALVWFWNATEAKEAQLDAFYSFHPVGIAAQLSRRFQNASSGRDADERCVTWTFEADCFVARSSKPFRIMWPQGENTQHLPFRLGIDEGAPMSTELRGQPRFFVPSPTAVTLPSVWRDNNVAAYKQFVVAAKPRYQAGAQPLPRLVLVTSGTPQDGVVYADIGALPAEWPVAVFPLHSDSWDDTLVFFGRVAGYCLPGELGCPEELRQSGATIIELLSPPPLDPVSPQAASLAPTMAPQWGIWPLFVEGAAANFYFPTQAPTGWNRLAEIFGSHSGANLWADPLVAPAQWNFDPPACETSACST